MTLILWIWALTSAISLALLIDLEVLGTVLCLAVFGAPAIWANWHLVRMAVEAERLTD